MAAGVDFKEQLRARRAALRKRRLMRVELPGWEGSLIAWFRPYEWEETKDITTRADNESAQAGDVGVRAELNASADLLARAVVDIKGWDGEKYIVLSEDEKPLRFDNRLATVLDMPPAETAREILIQCFGTDLSVVTVHQAIMSWSRNLDGDARAVMEGESEATLS